ncbi:MAG: RibD family protein [Marinoscillum sp.]
MNKLPLQQDQYESLWVALLKLKKWVEAHNELPLLYLNRHDDNWSFKSEPVPSCFFSIGDTSHDYHAVWNGTKLAFNQLPTNDTAVFLQLYLPHCLASLKAQQLQQTLCTAHIAQTIDGKIATFTGNSKWIGNQENLIHAHRMRALHDAVMVGKNTYLTDNPRLTVRHVPGNDPRRFVIWGREHTDPKVDITLIVIQNGKPSVKGAIELEASAGQINCADILKSLYQKGINSVYLEGGGMSISRFLEQGLINQLQIHISSKILGSGISAFRLEERERIQDSLVLTNKSYYQIGDEIMIVNDQE